MWLVSCRPLRRAECRASLMSNCEAIGHGAVDVCAQGAVINWSRLLLTSAIAPHSRIRLFASVRLLPCHSACMSSAFGSPAPGFAAPQRIRVVSHPPLPPLRAWLPLGGAGMSTIAHLSATVANMLGTRQELEIDLQGELARAF